VDYVNPIILEALAYLLILNGSPDAPHVLERIVHYEKSAIPWEAELGKRAVLIFRLLTEGRADAVKQLQEWEQESLKNLHFQ
jgi:hypothetical protein